MVPLPLLTALPVDWKIELMLVKFGFACDGQALVPDDAASEYKNCGEALAGSGYLPAPVPGLAIATIVVKGEIR
jgi:hypothetical protein